MWVLDSISALLFAMLLGSAGAWWVSSRRSRRAREISRFGLEAQAALWRHPAGRGRSAQPDASWPRLPAQQSAQRPAGPDDDPEFIRALERLIRGDRGEPV